MYFLTSERLPLRITLIFQKSEALESKAGFKRGKSSKCWVMPSLHPSLTLSKHQLFAPPHFPCPIRQLWCDWKERGRTRHGLQIPVGLTSLKDPPPAMVVLLGVAFPMAMTRGRNQLHRLLKKIKLQCQWEKVESCVWFKSESWGKFGSKYSFIWTGTCSVAKTVSDLHKGTKSDLSLVSWQSKAAAVVHPSQDIAFCFCCNVRKKILMASFAVSSRASKWTERSPSAVMTYRHLLDVELVWGQSALMWCSSLPARGLGLLKMSFPWLPEIQQAFQHLRNQGWRDAEEVIAPSAISRQDQRHHKDLCPQSCQMLG